METTHRDNCGLERDKCFNRPPYQKSFSLDKWLGCEHLPPCPATPIPHPLSPATCLCPSGYILLDHLLLRDTNPPAFYLRTGVDVRETHRGPGVQSMGKETGLGVSWEV